MKKLIFLIFLSGYLLCNCSHNYKSNGDLSIRYWQKNGNIFGTSFTIVLEVQKNFDPDPIENKIQQIFNEIDQAFSLYKRESKIYKLNQNHFVLFNAKEIYLFQLSKEICFKTKGYFFPYTKDTLKNLKMYIEIKEENYQSICNLFSIKETNNKKYIVKKKYPFIEFDFNAIAKGYTVDLIKDYLNEHNIKSYLIEIGGEICTGNPPEMNHRGWLIALETPTSDPINKRIYQTLYLKNICLATSGNYFKNHIFNPYSLKKQNKNISVSVLGPSCTIADAYATFITIKENYTLYSNEYNVIRNKD
ncbi:MAG: FAD:protein FMN transferase [Leptospiraceae bacterium]|nr:MAG: FAD:protein FMN transferase [Leptospiraceae bacterium]